ncbi:transmembrane emp24 domain-containing protein 7-like protein [Dinothrombium tinctorium]|uniref:Transmembrane emp24 domain-containing protein 7-like protein n=1 Tax=Dinothrombium tinctorium TaxID=1965070 RepID=A0A3S3PVL3_9ACAR|nr:transmembrane emp24 domain-containing protein 7-like protein [Dinothrombium tinctorium]RWS08928.1 transmembrane emp24 domain-containing protein 7-like protein [Dinothrombium tinctorium]RWS09990.1 transmembrane emp24 domain-containing protein 7-like protein [Dinothrombium tinctorium]
MNSLFASCFSALSLILFTLFCTTAVNGTSVELTFELADNDHQCFYEEIKKGIESTLEFQVVTGGHYDVDVKMENPHGQAIYQGIKKQFDSFKWTADATGTYKFCFNNEFSTFSHKLIYFDLQVGYEPPLPGVAEHATALTKMEHSTVNIHENLNQVLDAQTHYRLNEAKGRKRAEELNARVMNWSIGESFVILVITIGQVMILKNFFTDRKSTISST